MPTVEASVEVAAPPNIVWELIADPSRHTEFGTFVSEVQLVSPLPSVAAPSTTRRVVRDS